MADPAPTQPALRTVPRHRRAAAAAAPPPDLLGPWQLIRLAAAGDLFRVYQARPAQGGSDRPACYAVKVLAETSQSDAVAVEMLRREAWVGRTVTHPHLVSVLSSHVAQPPYYVVMPWLAGANLADVTRRAAGHLAPLPVALWLTRQVAQALEALHCHGWMHADVKPANILVSPEGHATLIDLAFARRPSQGGSLVDRCLAGTMHYVAPEMITSALKPDIKSDIYSLGVTLYELLTGRLPFQARELAELAHQHRQCEPVDLRALVPHVPLDVSRLVHRMIAKEPLRRPQTPSELIQSISALEIECFNHHHGDT